MAEKLSEKKVVQHVEYLESISEVDSHEERRDVDATKVETVEDGQVAKVVPSSAEDLVREVLSLEDDPTLNPWTFRMWFIGISISVFSSYVRM